MAGAPHSVSVSDRPSGTGWRHIVDDEIWLGRLMLAPAILYRPPYRRPFSPGAVLQPDGHHRWKSDHALRRPAAFSGGRADPKFLQALWNTFLFAFGSQLLVLILANILAQVLRYEFRGKWLVRCLILLPWVAPISLGSIGWLWIFDSLYSVLNWTLQASASSLRRAASCGWGNRIWRSGASLPCTSGGCCPWQRSS